MNDFIRDSRGASLVATIFVLVILSLLGASLCVLIAVKAQSGAKELQTKRALCLAESGIEYGLWNISEDITWTPDPSVEYRLVNGTFTMERIDNGDDTETLRTTGYVPDMANAVAKRVVEIKGTLAVPQHEFYKYGLWFDCPVTLDYASNVDPFIVTGNPAADMYASGDIVFANGKGKKIGETVRSMGTVTTVNWKNPAPWKNREEGVDPISPPTLDDDAKTWYQENAYLVYPPGPVTITGSSIDLGNGNLYYIDGTLSIGSITVTGRGTIVATGDIAITGTIEYVKVQGKTQGPLALVSFGNISCGQDTDPLDASMYANGQFIVTASSTLEIRGNIGSQGGFNLASGSEINISYDSRLGEGAVEGDSLPVAPSRTYAWKEVYR